MLGVASLHNVCAGGGPALEVERLTITNAGGRWAGGGAGAGISHI